MTGLLPRVGTAILLLPLAACMSLSGLGGDSKYACAAPEGVICDSVSGTYANALHDNLPSQRRAAGAAAPEAQRDTPRLTPPGLPRHPPDLPAVPGLSVPDAGAAQPLALRSQARYLRLWIKPWEDVDGDLFDQAHVYVQIDHGRWQIEHVQQAIRDRYAPLRPPPAAASGGIGPEAPTDSASAKSPTVQRPPGFSGFPSLNNPPWSGIRPVGSAQ